MKAKVVYYFNNILKTKYALITILFSSNYKLELSLRGRLYRYGGILTKPKKYQIVFIIYTDKYLCKREIMNTIEEQLVFGAALNKHYINSLRDKISDDNNISHCDIISQETLDLDTEKIYRLIEDNTLR